MRRDSLVLAALLAGVALVSCAHGRSGAEIRDLCTRFAEGDARLYTGCESKLRAEERPEEPDEPETPERRARRRRIVRAAAAGLQAAGASIAARPAAATAEPGCASDYACGVGWICLKRPYAAMGVCARAVNEYGAPTPALPRPESVGPGLRQCWTMADCPVGFACEDGVCVR